MRLRIGRRNAKIERRSSVQTFYTSKKNMKSKKDPDFKYDVAISFAGEDRNHARTLAKELVKAGVSVFYDEYEQSGLWGADLPSKLHSIYSREARYVILFVSKQYLAKKWTIKERIAAQERAIDEMGKPYILPIRVDNVEIPGLPKTLGYLSIDLGVQEICKIFLAKLGADRLKQYEESLPQYGGDTPHVMTEALLEDLDYAEAAEYVESYIRQGFIIIFPTIEIDGEIVTPKINRWPSEDVMETDIVDTLKYPYKVLPTKDGFTIENDGGPPWVEIRIDNTGLIVGAKSEYRGGA